MKPYLQTTAFTTAASSLLAILHYFNPEIKLSKDNEFKIWQNTVILPTRASSIFALADYAIKQGLNLYAVVESQDYDFPDYRFYRYKKEDVENAAFSSRLHLKTAKKNQLEIIEKKITLDEIKELLKENILLLRINTKPIRGEKRNTSNFIVLSGYHQGYFHIIDPQSGGLSISEKVMEESFSTLETKKYRDHQMIIFKKTL